MPTRNRLMRCALVITLILAATGCSKHRAPPERVSPEELENFIGAQEAALNNAQADEDTENAAEARNEINQTADKHDGD